MGFFGLREEQEKEARTVAGPEAETEAARQAQSEKRQAQPNTAGGGGSGGLGAERAHHGVVPRYHNLT